MLEILRALSEIPGLLLPGWLPLPQAGVGGGMEALETVDLVKVLKFTAIFVVSLGGLFGIGLAMAAKKFAVKMDPRIEQVKDVLAGAHCGACGYAGCQQYAEAVVGDENVAVNLCTPGGADVAEQVAQITGKVAEITEPIYSRIMCQGGSLLAIKRFEYEGVKDCRAAVIAGGGDKACRFGCLGYGTCVGSCPFGAMSMSDDNLPLVDMEKCTGCRVCEKACPMNVIEVLPGSKAVLVTCHSKDKGVQTKKNCKIGCIGCGICVKVCPFDAPAVTNNLSVIDIEKCRVCGLCVTKCPTKAISDFIPERGKAEIGDKCIGCHSCAKICPVDAPSGEQKKQHSIDQSKCMGCGICTAKCPVQAIDGTFNAKAVHEAAAAKKAAQAAKKAEAAASAN